MCKLNLRDMIYLNKAEQMIVKLLGAFFILLSGCNFSKEPIFPEKDWETQEPKTLGVDETMLMEAVSFLESKTYADGVDQLLIIKDGYVIFDGGKTDSVHNIYSCSKTFTSTALLMMVQQGLVKPEDKAAKFEPLLQKDYPEVTFRHFATMTSGYSAKGGSRWPNVDYADWSWTVYDPDTPYFKPGSAYAYWDEAQMMYGRCLTQVLQSPLEDYLKKTVTNEIHMDWSWGTEKDLNGIPINNGCTGVMTNARNFAKYGWLFLNNGRWQDKQLINSELIKLATSVQVDTFVPVGNTDRRDIIGPGCYGFNWWINGRLADGTQKLPGAPDDCYFASGFNNNKCFVIPSWNTVIVRMGEDGNIPDADHVYGRFIEMYGKAIGAKPHEIDISAYDARVYE